MSADCDCCAGVGAETPATVSNRPGQSSIAYRVGTYGSFRSSLLAALGGTTAHGLRTREPSDFSIAWLDSCAIVSDVLTFYDERIANENYLRTATELLSLGELARLTGYQLSPGLSASAFLAFRLNDPPAIADPGAPGAGATALAQLSSALGVVIPAGAKVQSVPGPGQTSQTFETDADLDARWIHNALKPHRAASYPPGSSSAGAVYLSNGGAGVSVGDRLMLIDAQGGVAVRAVTTLTVDPATRVALASLDEGAPATPTATLAPATIPAPAGAFSDALVAKIVDGQIWDRDDLATLIARRDWSMDALEASVNAARQANPAGDNLAACKVKQASLFGHNAPAWGSLPPTMRYTFKDSNTYYDSGGVAFTPSPPYLESWDAHATLGSYTQNSYMLESTFDLDNVYPSVAPGVTLMFVDPAHGLAVSAVVRAVKTASRSIYAITGRVTNVTIDGSIASGLANLSPRTTTVYIQDAPVPLAPLALAAPVSGASVLIDRCALRVAAGAHVAVSGARLDAQGRNSVEIVKVTKATLEDGYTRLHFARSLSGAYAVDGLALNANVVSASNGETVAEVLGSGDASMAFQDFTLKQGPLTWVAAPIPGGMDAALKLYVDGIEWRRVPQLFGAGPTERVFALSRDKSGATNVEFGDGAEFGARLPSGVENVKATYRRGIGSGGLVDAEQLTMLLTRPPGVRDVANPLPADGAADPETVAQSRVNAPFAVRTLGRIVTLDDYADFVRACAGVAKARVDCSWRGHQRTVVLTVAGPGGAPVVDGSAQADALLKAVREAAEAPYPFAIASYRPRTFLVAAALAVDPAHILEDVQAAVRAALTLAFGFEARGFAQPVFRSEVVAVIQGVDGVVATALTAFRYAEAMPQTVEEQLPAASAAVSAGGAKGAELLTIDPIPAILTALT
jgi:hypothetical protein